MPQPHRPRRRAAAPAAAAALAGLVLVAGCTSVPDTEVGSSTTPTTAPVPTTSGSFGPDPANPALASFYSQQLAWTRCDNDFQCATLTVPLDYADPTGATLGLKVLRLRSKRGDDHLGSLVLEPGGPGASGVDYARAARAVTTDAVRARYDVVGFDPRGIGASSPIECLDDKATDAFIAMDGSPDTPAEVAEQERLAQAMGAGCQAKSPSLVAHVGTRDVARDLDVLRAALGDQKLNYLGKSYGTFIGATYAELFPQNVGRMVLDGVIDPALSADELALGQAEGFEVALRRFVEHCPQLDGCPLPSDPDAALAKISGLLDQIDRAPLKTESGRPLTQGLAVLGLVGGLYDQDSGWPDLAYGLQAAFDGDGTTLLASADYYADRDTNGRYLSNANEAIYAVNCWDRPATAGVEGTEALAKEWAAKAPRFGAYLAWGNLPCSTWPGHDTTPPHAITAEAAPEILVVGTRYDPATPVQMARDTAKELAHGVYLEWDGDGHTAYQRGSECIDGAVDAFLLDGVAPATGTVCR